MDKKTKKKLILGLGLFAILAVTTFVLQGIRNSNVDLTFDSVPVTNEEFKRAVEREYNNVINFYTQNDPDLFDSNFWTKKIGDKTPSQLLAEYSREEAKRYRAQYQLYKNQGYIESLDYDQVDARRLALNEDLKARVDAGETVYGQTNYDKDEYVFYEMTALRDRYIQESGDSRLDVSDVEISDYYVMHADEFQDQIQERTFAYIKLDNVVQDRALFNQLRELADKVTSMEDLQEKVKDYPLLEEFLEDQAFDSKIEAQYKEKFPEIYDAYEKIPAGQAKNFVEEGTYSILITIPEDHIKNEVGLDEAMKAKVEKRVKVLKFNDIVKEQMNSIQVEEDLKANTRFVQGLMKNLMDNLGLESGTNSQ